jgi:PAS domain S-box-containing protein
MKEHRKEPSNLLQGVFDFFQEPLIVTDPRGTVVSANIRMEELTGYTKSELQEFPLPHLVHHEERKTTQSDATDLWHVFTESTGKPFGGSLVSKKGAILPVKVCVKKIELDVPGWTFLVSIQDLTEVIALQNRLRDSETELEELRSNEEDSSLQEAEWEIMQLEERLRETENYLDNILRTSGECVIVTNSDNIITRMNAALVDTVGWGIEELLGKPLGAITPIVPGTYISTTGDMVMIDDSFITRYKETQSKVLHDGRHQYEMYLLQKCGKIVPVEVSTTLLYDEEKNRCGTVSVARDVTERKKMYEALKRAKEKAEDATRYKSEFLANMSHEIRTPMNAVIGFTNLLFETTLDAEQADYVQTVKQSSQALLELINDILDFSKIEAGKMDLEEVEFDPQTVAHEVCNLIKPKLEERSIELLCRTGDDIPRFVRGDVTKFRQVLVNLMSNAVKFTDYGEIELYLYSEEETEDGIKLHVKVRDTGIGIPQDKLKSIFNMFQQADGSTTRKFGGTGLGLSICKGISRAMDGDVWAESLSARGGKNSPAGMNGSGSIFHFTACLKKSQQHFTQQPQYTALRDRKILILDDNQSSLGILGHLVRSVGARAALTSDPQGVEETVVTALKNNDPFDLCLLDIQLPGISGDVIARRLRNHDELKKLPLIALSSSPFVGAKKYLEAGFDAFFPKPVNQQKFLDEVEQVLGRIEKERVKAKQVTDNLPTSGSPKKKDPIGQAKETKSETACILLVEDNLVNQKLASTMLSRAGYQVETANNGKEAVEKYKKSRTDNGTKNDTGCTSSDKEKPDGHYNLIFMDMQMPEMDGLAATQAIRKWEAENGCRVPVIAMTANASAGDRAKCLEAGMDDYLTKPIKKDEVFALIEKWKWIGS